MNFVVRGVPEKVEIEGLTPNGLPALRLLQVHSPRMDITCKRGTDFIKVSLGDIDLAPSLVSREALNVDRAQLSKLGG